MSTLNFKEALIDYYNNFDNKYELIYPEFKEYKEYLTITEINSCKYNKDKLDAVVCGKKQLVEVFAKLRPGFVSSAYLKE